MKHSKEKVVNSKSTDVPGCREQERDKPSQVTRKSCDFPDSDEARFIYQENKSPDDFE